MKSTCKIGEQAKNLVQQVEVGQKCAYKDAEMGKNVLQIGQNGKKRCKYNENAKIKEFELTTFHK